jgi:hypothetical protein
VTVLVWLIGWFAGSGLTYLLAGAVVQEDPDGAQFMCLPFLPFWPLVLVVCFIDCLALIGAEIVGLTTVQMPPDPDDFMR